MKKALILHGKDGSSKENWFPWLQTKLTDTGYDVYVPDLPHPGTPRMDEWIEFVTRHVPWSLDEDTIIIGHSAGAVAILGLVQRLPDRVKVDAIYLVGSFKDDLGSSDLRGLFVTPFDFVRIRAHCRHAIFLHSDDDPYCPLDHVHYLHKKIGGELIVIPGQKHFSVSTAGEKYRSFPYLLTLITTDEQSRSSSSDI